MGSREVILLHFSDTVPEHKQYRCPDEDFSLAEESYWGVFDGVTLMHQRPYPNPSPARRAAEIAAEVTSRTCRETKGGGEEVLREAFRAANAEIRRYNDDHGITVNTADYLNKQFAATVGAFGFLRGDSMYFGQLNDCGVRIYQDDKLVDDYVIEREPTEKYLAYMEDELNLKPASPEQHIFFRKNVVNNPDVEITGKKIGFGVMDGNPAAGQFFTTRSRKITPGQTYVFYTDGFIPFFYKDEFDQLLCEANETALNHFVETITNTSREFQKEKSLVVTRF